MDDDFLKKIQALNASFEKEEEIMLKKENIDSQTLSNFDQENLKDQIEYYRSHKYQGEQSSSQAHKSNTISEQSLFIIEEEPYSNEEEMIRQETRRLFDNISTIYQKNMDSSTQIQNTTKVMLKDWRLDYQHPNISQFEIENQILPYYQKTIQRADKKQEKIMSERMLSECMEDSQGRFCFDSLSGESYPSSQLKDKEINIIYRCSEKELREAISSLKSKGIILGVDDQSFNKMEGVKTRKKGLKVLSKRNNKQ